MEQAITGSQLQVGDTFRFPGDDKQLTVTGFRRYRNARHPELECNGQARCADFLGKQLGMTIFPDDRLFRFAAAIQSPALPTGHEKEQGQ